MKKLLLMVFLNSLVVACGFHLRGYEPLPESLQTLQLVTPAAYSQLATTLEHTLHSNGVRLVPGMQQAANKSLPQNHSSQSGKYNILQILNEKLAQQVTSIGSGGQNTIYLLTYTVEYQLCDAAGRIIQSPRMIRTTRNYSAGSNQILADTYVQQDLVIDMQRDIAHQLLNQMRLQRKILHLDAA